MEDEYPALETPPDHHSGFVAVLGKPKVGKSTLINRLVGHKVAITSSKPQTTRRRILGILTLPQAQVIFVDTPGIHRPKHKLGEYMVETAVRAVKDVDLVLFLVDASSPPDDEDAQIAAIRKEKRSVPAILVLNKMDLLPPDKVQAHSDAYLSSAPRDDWMMISALRGDNCDKLLEIVIQRLPFGPRYYPPEQFTDQEERFIVAELIREQALALLRNEVPYAVAVVVEEFQERKEGLIYIAANLFVEKESQKGIILGAGGRMIKQIGQRARQEIEHFLGKRVYLELWVKVKEGWRKKEPTLRSLGYWLPPEK